MKKLVLTGLCLTVASTAMAAGKLPRTVGEVKQERLADFADKTFNNDSIVWADVFHERVYNFDEIADFKPIRVYYRPHGFYVHTYSSPILESGYFITRPGEQPLEKKYLKLNKIGERVYQYRIESSYNFKK